MVTVGEAYYAVSARQLIQAGGNLLSLSAIFATHSDGPFVVAVATCNTETSCSLSSLVVFLLRHSCLGIKRRSIDPTIRLS